MLTLLRHTVFVVTSGLLALVSISMLMDSSFMGGARDGELWGFVLAGLAIVALGLSGLAVLVRLVTEGRKGLMLLLGGYGCILACWILIWGVLPAIEG